MKNLLSSSELLDIYHWGGGWGGGQQKPLSTLLTWKEKSVTVVAPVFSWSPNGHALWGICLWDGYS